ncbi:phosphatase PAP2 family protein [Curtobacterium sp. VKM Ac-2884]|uniref:phosphatase PAP2 family protein n=1 Tax=Curtobacterium sp. VKM Ac-2884 TaxID=2783818 RepID=UPI00188B8029|nr:phosphatase PAP2 family protein [Curtobacterium sp. VKM Ac-2884]MBF4604002.1 phosphatase PAP2 family protein [Curtobacterium sp. VKM Ac-2884]
MIVVFIGLTLTAVPGVGAAETGFDQLLREHLTPTALLIASGIGVLLEPAGGLAILVTIGAVVWWRSDRVAAMQFVAIAGVSWVSVEPVKLLVQRPRPVLAGVHHAVESWSYPSGHVALVTALVLGLVAVTHGKARVQVAAVGTVVVVVVATSRLALGVHYPTDVLAAIVWTSAVWAVVRHIALTQIGAGRAGSRRGPTAVAGLRPRSLVGKARDR